MSNRWSLGLACALAFAAMNGCAPAPQASSLEDRAESDAHAGSGAPALPAADAPQQRPSPREAAGGPVEVRVDGARVERIEPRGAVSDVSTLLLDGDNTTSITATEPIVLRVRLTQPRHISAVSVVSGTARVEVSTSLDGGAQTSPLRRELAGSTAWERVSFERPVLADTIELRWIPSAPTATLTEVELWSEGAPSQHVPGATLSSEIVADATRFGRVTPAINNPITLSSLTFARDRRSATASFRFARPSRCVRTFLRYEIEGITSVSPLARTLNGARIDGAREARRFEGVSVAAEEIASTALIDGDNELAFEPTRDAVPSVARIRRLDIVCVEDTARARDDSSLSAAQRAVVHSLTDGVPATSIDVRTRREATRWVFGVPSQIHRVSFFSPVAPVGRMELSTGTDRATSRVSVPLAGLRPGWNHVDIPSAFPASDAVDVRFAGGRESTGSVSELHFVASPVATPRSPRVVIT
jgi:hypothetical protein